ncbi:hypothetical protein IWT25_02218 [Secundilactobacillus pentosiphilus]|uniref:Uncharacterized protein n=1 Tax=Secundilactobacillus pentosiphilus TaxID=1714682 RepID=A0A1Z5IZH1_9LACO|nr:hypothetical protein [Secundilactobacillus pentosiphilus]GAX06871.1 hypothetical protein IWT25_02218 [Secundilactobacillus pentosiphilus]
MGRKKLIDDTELLAKVGEFVVRRCDGDAERFRIPEFGDYLRQNGYPQIPDHLIRRRKIVSDKIASLKQSTSAEDQAVVTTFKNLDVESFLEKNHSQAALKRSLVERDTYYKTVCDSALRLVREGRTLIDTNEQQVVQLTNFKHKNEELNAQITKQQGEIKSLNEENSKLRAIIADDVYPEIANELLKSAGLLKNTPDIIKPETMTQIITADTPIKSESKVIQGLFDKLED